MPDWLVSTVAPWLSVTDAPGTTAPVGSSIWPRRFPVACAAALVGKARRNGNRSNRIVLSTKRRIPGKKLIMEGESSCPNRPLQLRVQLTRMPISTNRELRRRESFCSTTDTAVRYRTLRWLELIAKAESLRKLLLVLIKVDQILVILGIFLVSSAHRVMRRYDDRYCNGRMPQTNF